MSHPFFQNLPDNVCPKLEKLGSWSFERMFTPHHVPNVTCHVSCVTYFFLGGDKVLEIVYGGSVINGAYPSSFYFILFLFLLLEPHKQNLSISDELVTTISMTVEMWHPDMFTQLPFHEWTKHHIGCQMCQIALSKSTD